MKKELSEIL